MNIVANIHLSCKPDDMEGDGERRKSQRRWYELFICIENSSMWTAALPWVWKQQSENQNNDKIAINIEYYSLEIYDSLLTIAAV